MSFGNSRDTSLNSKLTNCAGLEEICLSFAGGRVCLSISLSSPEEKIDLITAFNRRNGTVNKTKNNSLINVVPKSITIRFFPKLVPS
ncbi:MAG: hypothetical protein KJ711_04260 [Candidatus Omnitrophica bacterium]|nr:hypothetical protein [Candidatus Omnitrophota bacterium]MBU1524307.1 hypothetical protein [Candidatus Omnitrophota bacterium]